MTDESPKTPLKNTQNLALNNIKIQMSSNPSKKIPDMPRSREINKQKQIEMTKIMKQQSRTLKQFLLSMSKYFLRKQT